MTNAENAARIQLERSIVARLISHMETAGFRVTNVFDGEQHHYTRKHDDAMEIIFNLDEASLRFTLTKNLSAYDKARKVPAIDRTREPYHVDDPEDMVPGGDWSDGEHGVLLVLGNGEDVISDWNYFDDDHDGFNAAMQAFNYGGTS
jgi:hypothetical protein